MKLSGTVAQRPFGSCATFSASLRKKDPITFSNKMIYQKKYQVFRSSYTLRSYTDYEVKKTDL
jgi:hypothetical protein